MKNVRKFAALEEKELANKEKYRGGSVPPIDRPQRPTGGPMPPFGRAR